MRAAGARRPGALLATAILGALAVLALQSSAVLTVLALALADLGTSADVGSTMATFLAASLVGMGAGGLLLRWFPPGRITAVSLVVAATGLLVVAAAPSLVVFVAGRTVQGLGNGCCLVALYVTAAACFDGAARARLLRAVSTAWMLPTIVGPLLAGWATDLVGWRTTFASAAAGGLVVGLLAFAVTRGLALVPGGAGPRVLAAACLAGLAVCALQVLPLPVVAVTVCIGLASAVLIVLAAHLMLPAGALVLRRGIPAGVSLRGVIAGAFFGVEAWVPLLLIEQLRMSAQGAGLVVGLGGLCWVAGIQFPGIRWSRARTSAAVRDLVASCWITALGLVGVAVAAGSMRSVFAIALAWSVACYGMGATLPRISILVFEQCRSEQLAEASLGLQSSDALGCTVVVAVAGLAFAVLSTQAPAVSYVVVFGLGAAAAVAAALVARRIAPVTASALA